MRSRGKVGSGVGRRGRRGGIAVLASLLLIPAGTIVLAELPARAVGSFAVVATQRVAYNAGLVGFGTTPSGARMSRNVLMTMNGATPGGDVWYGVHDTTSTDVNAWYGGWTTADQFGQVRDIIIAGIPRSACGHNLLAAATDRATRTASRAVYVVDQCGPMVAASSRGVFGDGFTPGGHVTMTVSGTNLTTPPRSRVSATVTATSAKPGVAGGTVWMSVQVPCVRLLTISGRDLSTVRTDLQRWTCIR